MTSRLYADAAPSIQRTDPAAGWRAAIRAELDGQRRALFAQIASYPSPIAGCDQQFNHLLAQRDALTAELNALDALDDAGHDALDDFLARSRSLDEETRAALRANRPR